MTKKTIWYVCLVALCCVAAVFAVQAAVGNASQPGMTGNVNPNPGAIASTPVSTPTAAMSGSTPTAGNMLAQKKGSPAVAVEVVQPVAPSAPSSVLPAVRTAKWELERLNNLIISAKQSGETIDPALYARWLELMPRPNFDPLDQGNDACPATVIAALPYADAGTTAGLVNDYAETCVFDGGAPDVIYEYTAATTTTIQVSLCGSGFDTGLSVKTDGACPGTTEIACNDDFCGLQSQVDVGVTAGSVYFIIVDGYSSNFGAYTLNVTDVGDVRPCPTMEPEDAVLDPVPTTPWAGSIAGNCGNGGKWVGEFTAVAGHQYYFDLCADDPGAGVTNFDSDLKIVDAGGNILAGLDGSCVALSWNANNWSWTAPAAGTYYAVIAPYYSYDIHECMGTADDTFTMLYYDGGACDPLPPNDACENADVAPSLPWTFTGNRDCATPDCPLFVSGEGNVWISFTTTEVCDIDLDYCGSPTTGNAWLNLTPECPCATFTVGATFDWTTCVDGNVHMVWYGLAAGTYYYPVMRDGGNGAVGPYTITVSCTPPPPCVPDFLLTAPGSVTGNTCGAGDDCMLRAGEDQIVEIFVPSAGLWTFSLCPGFGWDTYLFLSETCCGAALASNDDFCGLTSEITYDIPAPGVYYIDVEPYSGGCGDWTLVVSQPVVGRCCYGNPQAPSCQETTETGCFNLGGIWDGTTTCADPCPVCDITATGDPEGEDCTEPDDFNGGCNSTPNVFSDIYCGQTIAGTSYFNGSNRDTDWYQFVSNTPNNFTLTGIAEFDLQLLIITNADCDAPAYVFAVGPGCQTLSVSTGPVPAGIYWFWVGPQFTNIFDCGEYEITMTAESPCACEPATDLTVLRALGPNDAVNVRWYASQTSGFYRVFGTADKNNDGDPDNGQDPMWALVADVPAPAVPGELAVEDSPLEAYANYVVVHDCAPRGRCCYGDPQAPSCLDNVTQEDCDALSGMFDIGLNCTDNPCPVRPPNDECSSAVPQTCPFTANGDNTGATTDGTCLGGGVLTDVWHAFTVSEPSTVTITECGTSGTWNNFYWVVVTECPCVTYILRDFYTFPDPNCVNGGIIYGFNTLQPGTYWIPILGEAGTGFNEGTYTVDVTCTPLVSGRCCYGDNLCADNVLFECNALGGTWTEGLTCADPCPAAYCAATHSWCDEYISNVTVGTINNSTGCTPGGYNDYTATSTNMTAETGYAITVTNPVPYSTDATGVWIDWDNNLSFTDAGEYTLLTSDGTGAVFTGTITPPAGTQGTHRMRIRLGYSWTPTPCGLTNYGETEDYTIVVQ